MRVINNSNREYYYLDYVQDLFMQQISFTDHYQNEYFFDISDELETSNPDNWRIVNRTKTAAAVLCVCLNIGTDPPDIIKPSLCARKECWIDPSVAAASSKSKGLETIGLALQNAYEKLQPKIKYKQCLDPTIDDLRKTCVTLRKSIKNEHILFHYNGHGVPRPTKNGEIW